ncbi:MAG: nodulation protein NfeD, partial [Phycisphaerae bacterium]
VSVQLVERAIREAEEAQAACVVLLLDTPGGLVDSTRRLVKRMLASRVPVVVYVSPSGGRAASAGVFITMAAHVAAMAPGTHIGAAHPVQLGGLPVGPPGAPSPPPREAEPSTDEEAGGSRPVSAMEAKIVNDTVAWSRSLAELRGRNADWAARAVRDSISVPASEALSDGVIDLIAHDLDELLARLDGRTVELAEGTARLKLAGADIRAVEMWWGERVLSVISNPNLAFLLLMLGFYGILFELYTPGWGVGGTLGAICLVLAFFGLAVLPINYVGLLLMAAALAMFVAEAFVTSFGLLAIAGGVCMVLGGVMLIDSPAGFMRVSLGVVIPVAAATAGISVFLVGTVLRARRRRVQTGSEGLIGAEAVARERFECVDDRFVGPVLVHGEIWNAVSNGPVARGEPVRIEDRRGLTLVVAAPDLSVDLSRPEVPA